MIQLNASEYFLVLSQKFWKAHKITRCFNSVSKDYGLFATSSLRSQVINIHEKIGAREGVWIID